jgi:hypothetical protein
MRLSALHAGCSLPQGKFLVLISIGGWVDVGAIVRLEGLGWLKNPTSSGIESATFQLVAQCLNQLHYHMPHPSHGIPQNSISTQSWFQPQWVTSCHTCWTSTAVNLETMWVHIYGRVDRIDRYPSYYNIQWKTEWIKKTVEPVICGLSIYTGYTLPSILRETPDINSSF